jgi:hypothetical protein
LYAFTSQIVATISRQKRPDKTDIPATLRASQDFVREKLKELKSSEEIASLNPEYS